MVVHGKPAHFVARILMKMLETPAERDREPAFWKINEHLSSVLMGIGCRCRSRLLFIRRFSLLRTVVSVVVIQMRVSQVRSNSFARKTKMSKSSINNRILFELRALEPAVFYSAYTFASQFCCCQYEKRLHSSLFKLANNA